MRLPVTAATLVLAGGVLLGGCGSANNPPPSPLPSQSNSPSAASSEAPSVLACSTADIQASAGPWGGAAGSRGADVVVQSTGTTSCVLPPHPVVAIVDGSGAIAVQTRPVAAAGEPTVGPGRSQSFSILFSNWCDRSAKLPLRVVVVLERGAVEVTGLSLATTDDAPPCNGPGQPASLSATGWTPN